MIRAAVALAALWAGAAEAETLELFFNEPLEGVYSQDWLGRVIGPDGSGAVLVFVRGQGKSGDFDGVLAVNCDQPQFSRWTATGGYLTSDDVPAPAIDVISATVCSSP